MRALKELLGLLFLAPLCVCAQEAGPNYDPDVAFSQSQAALGTTLDAHVLRDIDGQPFALDQLRGRPVVVSMIYTSCHHVCPTITRSVRRSVSVARDALGSDSFSVVTIGFDWQVDTPDRMGLYQRQFGISDDNWHFLSADAATVDALSANLGFQFFPSPKGFDHLTQTTVVKPDGAIYQQVYGQAFDAPALVEPLKQLVFDTPASAGAFEHWVDTLLLFCTVYDPNSGRYRVDYSILMMIVVGVLCLGATATFIAREWKTAR